MSNQQVPIIYECRRCWAILPYLDCPHNCPGADIDEQDEAFGEDLLGWKDELQQTGYLLDEAPPPQIVELIPDPPTEGLVQSYHVRQQGEEVPVGVTPIQVFEVSPGVFRPVSEVLEEAQQMMQQLMQQQMQQQMQQ